MKLFQLPRLDKPNPFPYVRDMIGHPLEVGGDEKEGDGLGRESRIPLDVLDELVMKVAVDPIHLIVLPDRFNGKVEVAAHEGVEGLNEHCLNELGHAGYVHQRGEERLIGEGAGLSADVHGVVADSFDVGDDAQDSGDGAKVTGHGLLEREKLHGALFDAQVKRIYLVLQGHDPVAGLQAAVSQGVNGRVEGLGGDGAHAGNVLLKGGKLLVETLADGGGQGSPPLSEPARDVGLGAPVVRVGEDHLGGAELDQLPGEEEAGFL